MLSEHITVTIFRAAHSNLRLGEDTFQVPILRGATVSTLKLTIFELYAVPVAVQAIRRDIDTPPMSMDERVQCDDGDVLHLQLASPLDHLTSFIEQVLSPSRCAETENVEYDLNFVRPGNGSRLEQRCSFTVVSSARVSEICDMVKLELDLENEVVHLQFAGRTLDPAETTHGRGMRDGDEIVVVVVLTGVSL